MTEQEMTFTQQQAYIACMAYFPDCDITSAVWFFMTGRAVSGCMTSRGQ